MFLFESSKEKAIREDVEKNMEICISNPKKYNDAKEILVNHLRGSDQKVIEMIVDNIKSTIKNEDYQPVRKYQAMLLLKDLMLTHNKALGKYVVKKILKRLTILAQHKSGSKDVQREQERARDIFGSVKKDQEQYAIKFFNTLLTALQQWGKNWPKAPDGPYKDFHRQYNDLLMNGVQFPKQRPKELSKSITGPPAGRLTRDEPRYPSVQPSQLPKSKPKQEKPPLPQRQNPPQRSSSKLNSQLSANLDQYFERVVQSVKLFNELLPECAQDLLPVISDIVGQIQKTIQAGNQLVIEIGEDPTFRNDALKLQKCFDFDTKLQKDFKILSKKPQQIDVFKSKYTKLSAQILTTLVKSRNSSSISPIKVEQQRESPSPLSQIKKQQTPKSEEKVEQKPKITVNKNRYVSVQGKQVFQNFAKNEQFHSKSGESVHSNRFGSFGGPANTERLQRASADGSPQAQVDQNLKKANSDRKESSKQEKGKEIPVIPQQKAFQINKQKFQTGKLQKQIKNNLEKPQTQTLFKQFDNEKKNSQKGSVKNFEPNFEDNSSFGPQNFQKNQSQPAQQEDFFAKLDQNKNEANKDITQNPRRKKAAPKQDNQDFFKVRMESQIDSSKLSGFEFSKIGDGSKHEMKNTQRQPQKPFDSSSKKDVSPDNPFGLNASNLGSKNFGNNSDFFQRSDMFGKSTVTQKVNDQNPRQQNPFATGNFGNMVQKNVPSINPFDNESVKSKKQVQNNSMDNPFGNSFQRSSKASKPVNRQQDQKKPNLNNSELNPSESKVHNPDQNFFEDRLNNSRNNVENPFQTETQKTNRSKNPFEEVKDFYRPPSTRNILEGLSQRNSFKNIQPTNKNNQIVGGNLGFNGFPEPIRDSLVFSAKVDKEASQYGLNFSQFADVGGADQRNPDPRTSDPFNKSQKKQDNQFSGFSLSNFPGIGQQQKKPNPFDQHNGSAADFFANFQKQSIRSKKSKEQERPSIQKKNVGFQDFFANNSYSNQSKGQNRKSNNNMNNFMQREKTVMSGQDKSFDFGQLDKISAIQNKGKQKNDFEEFTEMAKNQQKQGFVIDNKSQKSLSWGDFSARPDEIFDKKDDKSEKDSNQPRSNKLLQVQSRINIPQQLTDRVKQAQSKQVTSRVNKLSNQHSLNLDLQDFAPISKKGVEWNPLSKITKLKQSPYTYNVDDKKIQQKKAELLQRQKEYNEKLQKFKFARQKNDEIRVIFMQKMKKLEDIMHQKSQYEQILKKLKQTNGIKQNQIEELYSRIKKTQAVKAKILQKEKQLYELTKNQIYTEQKKAPVQRSMASKWQMFNKNLEHNRNSMQSMHSQYTNGY